MAKLKRAEWALEGDPPRRVSFEPEWTHPDGEITSVVALEVLDLAEAEELLTTLERSRAQKRAQKKSPAPAGVQSGPPADGGGRTSGTQTTLPEA